MNPYSPIPRLMRGVGHSGLIHRLLRPGVDPDIQRIDLITTTQLRLTVLDTGQAPLEYAAEGDTCIHVLWQAQEQDASIHIGGERFPIAPGDTVAIPAGDPWLLSPNQLVISIARRSSALAIPIEPAHGPDRFIGHNRETRIDNLNLSRWKLTEPLTLPDSGKDLILVSLYADLAIQYNDGVAMLRQGETSVIRPGTGQITLVPNGLTYVLVMD